MGCEGAQVPLTIMSVQTVRRELFCEISESSIHFKAGEALVMQCTGVSAADAGDPSTGTFTLNMQEGNLGNIVITSIELVAIQTCCGARCLFPASLCFLHGLGSGSECCSVSLCAAKTLVNARLSNLQNCFATSEQQMLTVGMVFLLFPQCKPSRGAWRPKSLLGIVAWREVCLVGFCGLLS